ncbi:PH domain-containing protein [Dactylosporangium darangshiense]|uniref:PH domain-containing protein n=1 Tax=Dactylosporangium darangshiense TaxID=579108 RepID=UPI00362DC9DD
MGFPESVLTKDEQVVLHLHPHWKALFLPVVWFVLALAAVIALAIFTSWGLIPMLIVAGVALVVVLVVTVWPWIKWRTTHYVFTNERVIMRSGVFSRSGQGHPARARQRRVVLALAVRADARLRHADDRVGR